MINAIFEELKKKDIFLNEQQMQAAAHGEGPCIVLAVPGSGKTTTMVVRIYILIKYYKVDPQNILTMTFSRLAARDMRERFKLYFEDISINDLAFSTIHSFSYSVLKSYEKEKNIKYKLIEGNEFKTEGNVSSEERKVDILRRLYKEINGQYINDDILELLCNDIGLVKNKMIDLNDFTKYNFKINNFIKIFTSYEDYKKRDLLIDYDDMLTIAYKILTTEPKILTTYRNKYKYILIDEGQDTSIIQHRIIQLLVYPCNNIFIVADDDQSIYGFRAAEPKELLNFKESYHNAKLYFMEQNYRSTNNIVMLANEFIKCNKDRYVKNLFTERETGSEIQIIIKKNEIEQAKFLAEKFFSKKDELRKIAVLYRNNISSVILGDELERNEIPFYMKDIKLYIFNHWVTLDINAYLKFSQNNNDIKAFERIYYKIGLFLTRPVLDYVKNYSKKSIFETLMLCPMITNKQRELIWGIKLKSDILSKKRPDKAIEYIYNEMKYKDYLRKDENLLGYSSEGFYKIIHILKVLAEKTRTFSEFFGRLDRLKLIFSESVHNKDKNVITLTTIHSAKGLEYDTVYMIDLADGEFPSYESIMKNDKDGDRILMEEENRLFYVGITRAKNKLNIIQLQSKNGVDIIAARYVNAVRSIVISQVVNIDKSGHSIVGYNFNLN